MSVDIYDENGVGGGASGVSGGLLHPYSPKGLPPSSQPNNLKVIGFVPNLCGYSANGLASVMRLNSLLTTVKLLWRGAEFWKESMDLLRSAEQANGTSVSNTTS